MKSFERADSLLKESVEMMPGGQPMPPAGGAPMDPAMAGGMPMDPAMMGMDPAMAGGAPPMDPAMMGMDPAMAGGMPPMGGMPGEQAPDSEIMQGILQAGQTEAGAPAEGQTPVTKEDVKEIVQEAMAAGGEEATGGGLGERLTQIEQMLSTLLDRLGMQSPGAEEPGSETLNILSDEAEKLKATEE